MATAAGKRGRVAQAPPTGVAGIVTEIRAEIAACRLCPAMRPYRKQPPESFGTTRTGYMLVGEAPGRTRKPFSDERGRIFREALSEVGDERYRELEELFFLADAVRCTPLRKQDRKRTRPPTKAECRTCNPYLQFELRALRPRLVLAVGANAAQAVLGRPVDIEAAHATREHLRDIEVLPLLLPTHRAALKRAGITAESYRRWLAGLFGSLIDAIER